VPDGKVLKVKRGETELVHEVILREGDKVEVALVSEDEDDFW
jgi:hypothetical protein